LRLCGELFLLHPLRISAPLSRKNLPPNPTADDILNAFLDYLTNTEVEPYDHQEEAILELFAGNNVILNTPTGSGKSLVALALQFKSLCQGRRSYYTVPIKALANEKFLSLCHVLGPENVGMITGHATVTEVGPCRGGFEVSGPICGSAAGTTRA
jgi:superfamily II RNA helicase